MKAHLKGKSLDDFNNLFEKMSIDWYIIQLFPIDSHNLLNTMTLTLKQFNHRNPESKLFPDSDIETNTVSKQIRQGIWGTVYPKKYELKRELRELRENYKNW